MLRNKPESAPAAATKSADTAVVGAFAAQRLGAFRSIKSPYGFLVSECLIHSATASTLLHLIYRRIFLSSDSISWPGNFLHGIALQSLRYQPPCNTDQRSDTLLAAKLAGFELVRLLDEPTAAFYYSFEQNRDSFRSSPE